MVPAPRDLTSGQLKLHSTPMGVPATSEDLYRTLSRGMPGTAMPAWSGLSSEDRWQLVTYVRSLSPRFDGPEAAPLEPGDPPAFSPALEARGQAVFHALGCTSCHGADARGDGPAAATLVDTRGEPIAPADLTRPSTFLGGDRPSDVFRSISAGLDGTPMLGYAAMIQEADRWALVAWLDSISGER